MNKFIYLKCWLVTKDSNDLTLIASASHRSTHGFKSSWSFCVKTDGVISGSKAQQFTKYKISSEILKRLSSNLALVSKCKQVNA